MLIVEETPERTTTTAAAVMAGRAAPSQGSTSLSSWRVRMVAGAAGPEHVIDREQLWMLTEGAATVTVDGATAEVHKGMTLILPAGATRQIQALDAPMEALVCMPAGGHATVPGNDEQRKLPWAE